MSPISRMSTDSRINIEMSDEIIAVKRGVPIYVGVSESPMKELRMDPLLSIRTNQPVAKTPPNQISDLTGETSIVESLEHLNETESERIDKALKLVSETVTSSLSEEGGEPLKEIQGPLLHLFQLLQECSFVVHLFYLLIDHSYHRSIRMFISCHRSIVFSTINTNQIIHLKMYN